MKKVNNVRFMVESAVIAALYTVLTFVAASMNLAYGPVQFRFSEAMTVLPAFTPAAIPGLTIGCFLSNLGSPLGIVDWFFGTLATLLAAIFTYLLRNVKWKGIPFLSVVPPVICNAVVIGVEIACLSDNGSFSMTGFSLIGFWSAAISVGLGELVVCAALGFPLMIALHKIKFQERLLKS